MPGIIDDIVIKVCENFPLGITFFERESICRRPNTICYYCIKNSGNGREIYFCNKKTYTIVPEPENT